MRVPLAAATLALIFSMPVLELPERTLVLILLTFAPVVSMSREIVADNESVLLRRRLMALTSLLTSAALSGIFSTTCASSFSFAIAASRLSTTVVCAV